ncbi:MULTISPECIES: hypothetical protein [unclassified Pantoea]|uniref:hypothetical protein n=1 Tax=unclassified Pantoea TaxID=2630326 RepID=UPI00053489BF|nr:MULTISPECIES: hypothetical protein [unclassified Pantoea]MDU6390505.1 hypothetical protein [Pantoea sp.]
MQTHPYPWLFYPELSEERLSLIAEELLKVLDMTWQQLSSPLDDNYTRGTCTFGRQRQMLIALCLSGKHNWLQLTHPGMDVTFNIENIPVRFFADDPDNPKKPGFFRRNEVDQLFEPQLTTPTLHRFVVEKPEFEGEGARVHFIGTNALDEIVSKWTFREGRVPPLHAMGDTPPASVPIVLDPIRAPTRDKQRPSDNK